MKKIYTLLFALGLGISTQAQGLLMGDTNGNGALSIADIALSVDMILENQPLRYTPSINSFILENQLTGTYLISGESHTYMQGVEYVDLELSDGTLWATCSLGANSPEAEGAQYAWAETAPKAEYTWDTYVGGTGSYGEGQLYTLLPEDDAATVAMGTQWVTPSAQQIRILLEETTRGLAEENGVEGYRFTSINNPDKSIFFPRGRYWTRTLDEDNVSAFFFNPEEEDYELIEEQYHGLFVRPVFNAAVQKPNEGGYEGEGDGNDGVREEKPLDDTL